MATLSQRIKAAVQAIGADIKAISAKTNLLKSAAYRDTGRGVDRVPVFEPQGGLAGFGYGGTLKPYAYGYLSDLVLDTSTYSITNISSYKDQLPAGNDYSKAVNAVLSIKSVQRQGGMVKCYQYLTIGFYEAGGDPDLATVIMNYTRAVKMDEAGVTSVGGWQAIGGSGGADITGSDISVNSIKSGPTSPKVGFETIRLDLTYANFGYMPDGITQIGDYDMRGSDWIGTTAKTTDILSMNIRVYAKPYPFAPDYQLIKMESQGMQKYYNLSYGDNGATLRIMTAAHAAQKNQTAMSGEALFGEGNYAELFVIYKV